MFSSKCKTSLPALIAMILLACVCSYAQTSAQKERTVWIRLKTGEVLTGSLVKMDTASVDFKVKGVLQSVSCDDLTGVMFIAPSPRPTPTPAPVAVKPQEEQVVMAQTPPDHCVRTRTQPNITIAGGQYYKTQFGNKVRDFHFRGSFTAHGGKVSAYIVDAENFANLVNFKKFRPFYSATNVTEGEFDVALKQGNYHFVWWNESRTDTRVIEAELCFSNPE